MIVLAAKYFVKAGRGDEVEAALRRMAPLVKADEPGCALYHANRSAENRDVFLWKFEQMIAHVSTDELLRPGEVLGSGTVGGGSGAERGTLLRRGDVVELEVERLGTLRNRVT